jgi:hypothetical protein
LLKNDALFIIFFFFEEVDVIAAGNGEGKGKYLVKTCK